MTRSPRSGAVAYIRTSTSRQELSPAAQRHAIETWACARDVEVLVWHEDLGSSSQARVEDRPVLAAAILDVRRKNAEFLVAARADRYDRKGSVSDQIRNYTALSGGCMVSADGALGDGSQDDPTSKFIHQIMALVREYEVDILRSRVREGLATKRRDQKRTGSIPHGWMLANTCSCTPRCRVRSLSDGSQAQCERLVPDRESRAAACLAAELQSKGFSLRKIGSELEGAGYRSRGARWHAQSVKDLIAALHGAWSLEKS